MKYLALKSLTFVVFIQFSLFGQDGSLDPDFGIDGWVTTDVGVIDIAKSVAEQADGKLIIGGITGPVEEYAFLLVRYNTDGSLDETFGIDGIVQTTFGEGLSDCNDIVIQDDGKVIAIGIYVSSEEEPGDLALARYNADGSLDETFSDDGKLLINTEPGGGHDGAFSAAIQADGKLVVLGFEYETDLKFTLLRFNTDGTLDGSFGTGGVVSPIFGDYSDEVEALDLAINDDGEIFVAASSLGLGGDVADFSVVKYDTDGLLDLTFGTDGQARTNLMSDGGTLSDDFAAGIGFQSSGKIIVTGMISGAESYFAAVRYEESGELDSGFGTDGVALVAESDLTVSTPTLIQLNDKIIIAGYADEGGFGSEFVMCRLTADGALDTDFGTDGIVHTNLTEGSDIVNAGLLTTDGQILLVGESATGDGLDNSVSLVRYLNVGDAGIFEGDQSATELHIYPNPVQDSFTVSYQLDKAENLSISLYSIRGEIVYSFLNSAQRQPQVYQENFQLLSPLASGEYLLVFETESWSTSRKITAE